jgi:deoxyribodipyrimidine photo-lyase
VFTLRLPWELGADFFYRHLLDGDPASNTLGWRWVCGLHTRGKTYLARPSNIARYTDGRFDPAGQLADEATALEEDPAIADRRAPVSWLPGLDSEKLGEFGLLLTEEDGHGESLPLPHEPRAALGLLATDRRSPLPVDEGVRAFARGAVADAAGRLRGSTGSDGSRESLNVEQDDWTEALLAWAGEQRLAAVVTAYAPTGPVAEALVAAEAALAQAAIPLLRVLREHDRHAWPYADRGFFKLKKRVPGLLAAAGLPA